MLSLRLGLTIVTPSWLEPGSPRFITDRLQRVLNAAARVIDYGGTIRLTEWLVLLYCAGLKSGVINKPQRFTIETRGAGQGGVGLSVVGPTEPKIGCVDNHDGTLTVEYLPYSVGSYEIAVSFADQPVPGMYEFSVPSTLSSADRRHDPWRLVNYYCHMSRIPALQGRTGEVRNVGYWGSREN